MADDSETVPDLGWTAPPAPAKQAKPRGRRARDEIHIHQKFDDVDPDRVFRQMQKAIVADLSPATATPKPPAEPPRYGKHRVVEDIELPRPRGFGMYVLERGQVLSEQHYDIGKLLAQGVKLEPVEE